MVKCRLATIMGEQKIRSVSRLANMTNLSPHTIAKLYDEEELGTVKLETFLKVCDALGVSLCTLLEYTPTRREAPEAD